MPTQHIAILGFDGFLPSGIVGLADMFWLASQAMLRRADTDLAASSSPAFVVRTVSVDGRPLRDGRGRLLDVDGAVADLLQCDAVLVPGLVPAEDGLPPRSPAMAAAGDWLRVQHAQGAVIGGSCAGVFVLGESGLLDRRRCTTTWWLHDALKHRYPRADAVRGSALIEDHRIITVGGPLSWVDLALRVIGRLAGPEAARTAADFAVVDNTPLSQSVYAPQGYVNARDPLLLRAEQLVRQAAPGLTAAMLAQALGTSERTLHRRLRGLADESPKAFITRIRIETARTLLEGQASGVKRIAQQSGYDDEASFRRAFTQHTGMSPTAYRRWVEARRLKA